MADYNFSKTSLANTYSAHYHLASFCGLDLSNPATDAILDI
jgi:hypothetical protein